MNNINRYSGILIPPGESVLSLNNQLRITFTSDQSVSSQGFLASYQEGKIILLFVMLH